MLLLFTYIPRETRSVPSEWVVTTLMAAVGSLASKIRVRVNSTYNEPIFLYSIILGLPGTKKTSAIQFMKEEILKLVKKYPEAVHVNSSKLVLNFDHKK